MFATLFAAIFLLNNVIGAVLNKERWMVPIDCIPLRFTARSTSSRLKIFGLQKQASCGWRLIYANYYPRYNLAGKSNSTFSSKINRFDGIINR